MQRHRALGNPGRAAGVLEQGYVVRTYLHLGQVLRLVTVDQVLHPHITLGQLHPESLLLLLQQSKQERQHRRQGFLEIGNHDGANLGLGLDLLDARVEIAHHKHNFCPGVVGLVFDFARAVKRIGCNHHCA